MKASWEYKNLKYNEFFFFINNKFLKNLLHAKDYFSAI